MADRGAARRSVPAVALIGCGRIGSTYDEAEPGRVLTHASAVQASPHGELVAVCDTDPERAARCGARRGVPHYVDARTLLERERPDVLCIATPSEGGRLELVELALEHGVRGFFCEKPVAKNLEEALALRSLVQRSVPFAVNYLRSWSPGLERARAFAREGRLGAPERVVVHYGKGFANNASHAVDLLRHFLGWPLEVRTLHRRDDGRAADPSLDVQVLWRVDGQAVPGYFVSTDYRHKSVFEVDLLGAAGRIRFVDAGREVVLEQTVPDPDYPGVCILGQAERCRGELEVALLAAVSDLCACVRSGSLRPASSLEDAVRTLRVVDAAQRGATA